MMLTYLLLPALALAGLNPHILVQQVFVLRPSCYFTWGNFFIGYGVDAVNTNFGVQYTDAVRVCQFYTNTDGIVGEIVPPIPEITSLFPMALFCQPSDNLAGWVSSTTPTCNVLTEASTFRSTNLGELIPVGCTDFYSAVYCYYPTAVLNQYSTTVTTTILGSGTRTATSTILVPSITSSTVTALSTTPTTTTETDLSVANSVTFVTQTLISVVSETSETLETTTIRSTLRITDTEFITTTFTYAQLSISVSVPTVTVSDLVTKTLTLCPTSQL